MTRGWRASKAADSWKLLRMKAEQALVLGPGLAALLLILVKGRNPRKFTRAFGDRGSGPSGLKVCNFRGLNDWSRHGRYVVE